VVAAIRFAAPFIEPSGFAPINVEYPLYQSIAKKMRAMTFASWNCDGQVHIVSFQAKVQSTHRIMRDQLLPSHDLAGGILELITCESPALSSLGIRVKRSMYTGLWEFQRLIDPIHSLETLCW
jgi:hypothetical protein